MDVLLQKNPISLLQEVSLSKFNCIPTFKYEEVKLQEFKCIVELCGFIKETVARGKKQAKTLAARAMLEELGILPKGSETIDKPSPVFQSQAPVLPKTSSFAELSNSNGNPQVSNKVCTHCGSCSLNNNKMEISFNEVTNQVPDKVCSNNDACSSSITLQPTFAVSKNVVSSSIPSTSGQQIDSTLMTIDTDFIRTLQSDHMDLTESPKSVVNTEPDSTDSSSYKSFNSEMDLTDNQGLSNNSSSNSLNTFTETTTICKSNPVTFLQEFLLKSNIVPSYDLVNVVELDSKEPTYFYEVTAGDKNALGSGSTKKEAKANAALSLMDILKLKYVENRKEEVVEDAPQINAVGQLITFCQTNNIIGNPEFTLSDIKGDAHCKVFSMRCTIGSNSVDRSAKTKKAAKNLCAKAMLELLQSDIDNFKIKNVTFESHLGDTDINERVWKRLDESGARTRSQMNATLNKFPIRDYIHLFENGFYGESDTLRLLKSWKHQQIYSLTQPDQTFRLIVQELSIEYELSKLESKKGVILNLYLKCNPKWCFMEIGSSVEEARRKIFISALEFLYSM